MNDLFNTLFMKNWAFILILLSLVFSWVLVIYRYILKVDEAKINTEYILKGCWHFSAAKPIPGSS